MPHVLKLRTQVISLQYYLVFDDCFAMVEYNDSNIKELDSGQV
jgi:hypothetical protein